MEARLTWTNPITPKLVAAALIANEKVDAVLQYHEASAQNRMREGAPWQDQTGNARGGLFAQAYAADDERGLVLYHTVPYGVFLELANSGKYQIIMPTVEEEGREIMKDLRVVVAAL